jgi:pimeloyl-ACP methyl ester carboxylesterase
MKLLALASALCFAHPAAAALRCSGQGASAVVLLPGAGANPADWEPVQKSLSSRTRVCIFHPEDPEPQTLRRHVHTLRQALRATAIPPPYVLAGHSLGGLTARLFYRFHPAEVRAIALVDAASEDAQLNIRGRIVRLRETASRRPIPDPSSPTSEDFLPEEYAEMHAFVQANPQSLGSLPLAVLTRAASNYPPDLEAERLAQQKALCALSSRCTHESVPGAGHHIHKDHPDIVARAISQLLGSLP